VFKSPIRSAQGKDVLLPPERDCYQNRLLLERKRPWKLPPLDLDLGKELDSVPSGASDRTGTMQVLQGKGHTYVFIWMRYGHDDGDDNPKAKKQTEIGPIRKLLGRWGIWTKIGLRISSRSLQQYLKS
jgi:hypothetical protein